MKIESSGNAGNIQSIANATIQSAGAVQPNSGTGNGFTPTPAVSLDIPDSTPSVSDILGQDFDKNLSEKLKDPSMKKEFDKVLDYANKLLFNDNSVLKFSRHEATNTTLVKLVDSNTKEVLREFPPEKILNIIAGIWEVAGLVVNKKA